MVMRKIVFAQNCRHNISLLFFVVVHTKRQHTLNRFGSHPIPKHDHKLGPKKGTISQSTNQCACEKVSLSVTHSLVFSIPMVELFLWWKGGFDRNKTKTLAILFQNLFAPKRGLGRWVSFLLLCVWFVLYGGCLRRLSIPSHPSIHSPFFTLGWGLNS